MWPMLQTFFGIIYTTVSVTSIKILSKYTSSDINYVKKSLITLAHVPKVKELFCVIYATIGITSVKILRS